MLLEVLQGTEAGGFILIQDTVSYSGHHLLKSYISTALTREEEVVHVLGFEACEEELRYGLHRTNAQRLHFHNAYSDPLNWSGNSTFTVHQFNLEDVSVFLRQTPQAKAVTLVIDSLSWILRHHEPAAVCQRLQALKKGGAVRTVIGLLHTDMHQRGTVGSIRHLATSVVTVAPGTRGLGAVAKTTRRTKSGKLMQDEEMFSINEDLSVTIHSKLSHPGQPHMNTDGSEVDPTANLTFNLRLSDTEREAKEKLSLPFVFSKEKKSALLQPGPGSGRIVYEPDANDDYDQEDPDDDLDI